MSYIRACSRKSTFLSTYTFWTDNSVRINCHANILANWTHSFHFKDWLFFFFLVIPFSTTQFSAAPCSNTCFSFSSLPPSFLLLFVIYHSLLSHFLILFLFKSLPSVSCYRFVYFFDLNKKNAELKNWRKTRFLVIC